MLRDGIPEPKETKTQVLQNHTRGVETGFNECIKSQTIQYIKECIEDNFQSFRSEISNNYEKNSLFIPDEGLAYNLTSINELSAASDSYLPFELKMDEINLDGTIKSIANIRDLSLLESLSTLDDVYQFAFVLQYYLVKDNKIGDDMQKKFHLAYSNMPSHFYLSYIDEGSNTDKPEMLLIFSEILSGNKSYKKHILDYAKKSSSLVPTERNDLGHILYISKTPLKYIDSLLKRDADFVKKLVETDVTLLQYMHSDLRNNKDVVISAYKTYKQKPSFWVNYESGFYGNSLYEHFERGIGGVLKENKSFMMTIPELPYSEEEYKNEQTETDINEPDAVGEDDEGLPF